MFFYKQKMTYNITRSLEFRSVLFASQSCFFSSRRRHTRFDCDWSSDVCSSDLYTSSLVALAHEMLRAGRVDLRMKVVVTSAEPLGEDQRAAIEAAFGCPVRETYGKIGRASCRERV